MGGQGAKKALMKYKRAGRGGRGRDCGGEEAEEEHSQKNQPLPSRGLQLFNDLWMVELADSLTRGGAMCDAVPMSK